MEAVRVEPENEISIAEFVNAKDRANPRKVVRHASGQVVLVDESVLDLSRLPQSGAGLLDLGRRVRVFGRDLQRQTASYILPAQLASLPPERAKLLDGLQTPLGAVVFDHGLYLKLKPGIVQIGVNDRRDVILRYDETAADPTLGPVLNSSNTVIAGRAKRLVTRVQRSEHEADRAEALAWLKAMEAVGGRRTLRSRFSCAGIQYEQRGNVPYLYRTTQLNFFSPKDPDVAKIAAQVRDRFKAVGVPAPQVEIVSLLGLPADEKEYRQFLLRLRKRRKDRAKLGLPATLKQSRFYDPKSGGIVSSNFVLFCPLSELDERITVITVNTDYHGEVKSRGVLSPLMAIMSRVNVISAHAGCAVHNSRGTVTTFTGPTGTGKTTACTFWAEKNEKYRRAELRRRYDIDLNRDGSDGRRARRRDPDAVMEGVGILCQEDWVEIVPMRDGSWMFWPTERACYARTGGFPGLKFVLVENAPLLENACADLGAAGDAAKLGEVTHDYFPERLFYDPEWGHMHYDRAPRPITANVFLERDASLRFCVKRVEPSEAVEWLLKGRTPAGKYEPLYNAYPDFSGLLMEYGVVGDRLIDAYHAAAQGNLGALAKGDTRVGAALFEKLDVQVKLWRKHCESVPVFIVNGAPGLEITQDINWYLSEYPDFLEPGQEMTADEFKSLMHTRYGASYGPRGQWTHVVR